MISHLYSSSSIFFFKQVFDILRNEDFEYKFHKVRDNHHPFSLSLHCLKMFQLIFMKRILM
jgi:hypothetical protein